MPVATTSGPVPCPFGARAQHDAQAIRSVPPLARNDVCVSVTIGEA
jgi:hypothetical protein